jgi:hypothetical protein
MPLPINPTVNLEFRSQSGFTVAFDVLGWVWGSCPILTGNKIAPDDLPQWIEKGEVIDGWTSEHNYVFRGLEAHPLQDSFEILNHLPGSPMDFLSAFVGPDNPIAIYERRSTDWPNPSVTWSPTVAPLSLPQPYRLYTPDTHDDWENNGDGTYNVPLQIEIERDRYPVCEVLPVDPYIIPVEELDSVFCEESNRILSQVPEIGVLPFPPVIRYSESWGNIYVFLLLIEVSCYSEEVSYLQRWDTWHTADTFQDIGYISDSCSLIKYDSLPGPIVNLGGSTNRAAFSRDYWYEGETYTFTFHHSPLSFDTIALEPREHTFLPVHTLLHGFSEIGISLAAGGILPNIRID